MTVTLPINWTWLSYAECIAFILPSFVTEQQAYPTGVLATLNIAPPSNSIFLLKYGAVANSLVAALIDEVTKSIVYITIFPRFTYVIDPTALSTVPRSIGKISFPFLSYPLPFILILVFPSSLALNFRVIKSCFKKI